MPDAQGSSGWWGLLAIAHEARQRAADPQPESCPNDGQPYISGPDGRLYCPFDGYRPTGRQAGAR